MKYRELIKQLPASWNDVTLQMYLRTLDVVLDNELEIGDEEYNLMVIDNVLIVTASMIEVDVNIIRKYSTLDIIDVYNKMAFLNTEIEYSDKPLPSMKKEIDFSFDNMITYNQLTKDKDKILHNLPAIIKTYLLDSVTDDDILNMKMPDVMSVFLLKQNFESILRDYDSTLNDIKETTTTNENIQNHWYEDQQGRRKLIYDSHGWFF
ncbi:hypothetical protein [Pedobacter steynii]